VSLQTLCGITRVC